MKMYKFTITLTEKHMKQLEETQKTGDMWSCKDASYDIMNDLLDMQRWGSFVEEESK